MVHLIFYLLQKMCMLKTPDRFTQKICDLKDIVEDHIAGLDLVSNRCTSTSFPPTYIILFRHVFLPSTCLPRLSLREILWNIHFWYWINVLGFRGSLQICNEAMI